jgi:hypothetical protein
MPSKSKQATKPKIHQSRRKQVMMMFHCQQQANIAGRPRKPRFRGCHWATQQDDDDDENEEKEETDSTKPAISKPKFKQTNHQNDGKFERIQV